jgi:general secretion pathway protein H
MTAFRLKPYTNQGGYTLIEVLVVLLLIGVLASLVTISFDYGSSHIIQREAKRFSALIEQLCNESVINGRVYAVTQDTESSYKFVVLSEGSWVSVTDMELFRSRRLPNDMTIKLILPSQDKQKKSYLICSPIGVMSQFSAQFSMDEVMYLVRTNDEQGIEVTEYKDDLKFIE